MIQNMGSTDRILRIIVAIFIAILYYNGAINGMIATILGVLSIVFILTSIISFCPLYLPFGINTTKKK